MTIKQNGGIFGRNPTFNDVTVEGEFTSSSLNIDSNKLYVDPNNVRVGINTDSPDTIFEIRGPDPILTIRDTDTGSATANATLRLAETGASDSLDQYWDIKATNGFLHFIDNWNEGGGTGTRISFLDGGGIAFNGDTTQSNALDDYEEGSWTPIYEPSTGSFGSITYDTITGAKYTKIGNVVHVQGAMRTDAITVGTASGTVRLGGLPFAVSTYVNGQDAWASLNFGYSAAFNTNNPSSGSFKTETTYADLFYRTSANGGSVALAVGDLGTGTNDNLIRFSGTYITD